MFEKKPKNTSNWLDITPDKLTHPPLSGDTTADVAVIGGGLTGILSAWRLAQKGLSVVLIEKNHLCTGDTGLTTGFLLSLPDTSISELEKNKGLAFAKRYYETMSLAKDDIAHIIKTYNIDCDFTSCNGYYGSYTQNNQTLTNELETIKNIDKEVALISKNELPNLPFKEAICFPHEAKWNARKFTLNLLKHESSRQIKVYEETEAMSVESNGSVTIKTQHGLIEAKKTIVAIGDPSSIFPELKSLIETKITYVITARFSEPLTLKDLYWDTNNPYFYFRMTDDRTLLVGGCDTDPSNTNKQKPFEMLKEYIAKNINKTFKITNTWSGTIFHTADNLPYVFAHPHSGGKILVATGYAGNGMTGGILASQILCELAFGEIHDASDLLSLRRTGVTIPKPETKIIQETNKKEFVFFGTTNEFSDKKIICKIIHGKKILVVKTNSNYYSINNRCSHANGSLCDGKLTNTTIECPLHGAKFSVVTGAVENPPAIKPIETYPVRLDGEKIEVEIPILEDNKQEIIPTRETYWKQMFTFSGFAILFWLAQYALQYFVLAERDLGSSLTRSFSFAGTTLISLALLSSAIFKWWPKTSDYWRIRRYFGVSGFVFIFFHILTASYYIFHFDLAATYFSLNPFKNPTVFGSIGFAIFLPMTLTSTDWAVDALTQKWWKRLHRLVYIAYVSSIFHFITMNPPELWTAPGYLLLFTTALAIIGEIYWYFKIAAEEKFRSLGTIIGAVIITSTLVLSYFVYSIFFK